MSNQENEILKLWRDISFPGSFRGVKTFQAVLKSDKNIDVSEKELFKILKDEPIYLMHQLKPFKTKRRHYITHNYGELCQADIAYMFEDDPTKAKYFLLLVDVFSTKIFVEILHNKESETVSKALLSIFKRFGSPIYELQTDKGKEFTGRPCKNLFKNYHILFRTKRGLNKASVAESAIFRVKRKLFLFLRANLSQHWTQYIQKIVDSLNSIPLKKLGYVAPNSITDVTSSVFVDQNLQDHHLEIPKEVLYSKQKQNQENYENRAKSDTTLLKKDDYVYLKLNKDAFAKSFDIQENIKRLTYMIVSKFSLKNTQNKTNQTYFMVADVGTSFSFQVHCANV